MDNKAKTWTTGPSKPEEQEQGVPVVLEGTLPRLSVAAQKIEGSLYTLADVARGIDPELWQTKYPERSKGDYHSLSALCSYIEHLATELSAIADFYYTVK